MSGPWAGKSDTLRVCGATVTPLDEAIYRLRDANGPGGWRREDVLAVCDAAEQVERLRDAVRCAITYLQASGADVIAATAVDILEDATGQEPRP